MESTARLLAAIASACERYENGEVAIAGLQQDIEPIVSALEGDVRSEVMKALRHFLAQLEYIRFMYEDADHRSEVLREIVLLRDCLKKHGD